MTKTWKFNNMSKRSASLLATTSAVAVTGALALAGGASGAASLPTLTVALTGTQGVSVSGSTVSGAVSIVATFKGKARAGNGAGFGLVRLNPGATIQQAAGAVQSHGGDINALRPYGTLFVSASAPGSLQTILTPGNYVALNVTGMGAPGFAPFTVTQSSFPAALPAAKATQTSIEFAFRGPSILHDGTIVRAQNHGWLVHMIELNGVKNKAAGRALMAVLRVNSSFKAARPFLNGSLVNLLGPASTGAMQQMVLHAKPGYYVEACFMDTEDGREHVKLGMERLVRVVK
jgi:hypothetical protein